MRKKNIFSVCILFSIATFQPIEARPSLLTELMVGVCTLSCAHASPARRLLPEAPIWSAGAGDLYRVGNVTQLNAVYEQSQEAPTLCKLAGGGIASAWQTYAWDSDLWGVSLRIFREDLEPLTDEILVNTEVSGSQLAPSIACKVDGGLEVWWVSGDQDGDGDGVYRQRFNATGGRMGGEERVNSANGGDQSSPCVAARTTGGSVGVFESNGGNGYDIYTRFYRANGTAERVEERVNTYTADYQRHPVVTVLGNGHVLYLWETEQSGSGNDIHGCIYTDEGVLFRDEFPLNNYTANDQLFPAVCALPTGYVAGWSSLLQDGSGFGVYVGKYDDEGNRLIGDVRVNTQTAGTQSWLALSYLPGIGILATWTGLDGASYGIYGQLLTEELEPIGQEFLINTVTAGAQSDSTSVYVGDDIMLVAFQSNDGDSYGIFAQKFAFLTQAPTTMPTSPPSLNPSLAPSIAPTRTPTKQPTQAPSQKPTPTPLRPTIANPSSQPSRSPTLPTSFPTREAENKVTNLTTSTATSEARKDPSDSVSLHEEEGFIAEMFVYAVIGCGMILCCLVICYCIYRDYRKNVYAGRNIGVHSRHSSVVHNQGGNNYPHKASYAPVPVPGPIAIQRNYIQSPVPERPSSPTCHEGKQNNYADGQYIFADIQSERNQQHYLNHYPVNDIHSIYPDRQKGRRRKSLHKKKRKGHVHVPSQSVNSFIQTSEMVNRYVNDEIDDINNNVIYEDDVTKGKQKETKGKTDENVLPEDETIGDEIVILADSDQETKGNDNVPVEEDEQKESDRESNDVHDILLPHTNDDDYEEEIDQQQEEEDNDDQDNDDSVVTFINKNAALPDDGSNEENKGKDFVPLDSTPL